MYLGNDTWELSLSSGETVQLNKMDFEELVTDFHKKAFADSHPHSVETVPFQDVVVDDKYSELIKGVKENDTNLTTEDFIQNAIDIAIEKARDYYQTNFVMVRK